MEIHVHHKDFIKNKIDILLSPFKIQVLYNKTPMKAKWGKYHLEDDNRDIREVKIVDYLITAPYMTIDKKEKIAVFPSVPKYMFALIVPFILMLRFGIIGWALGALGIYSVRNICLSSERTTVNKCLTSVGIIAALYILLSLLIMGLLILMKP